MRRAVTALTPEADYLLVDARVVPGLDVPQKAIIQGDALSQSIAAASIIAKVERDTLMRPGNRPKLSCVANTATRAGGGPPMGGPVPLYQSVWEARCCLCIPAEIVF